MNVKQNQNINEFLTGLQTGNLQLHNTMAVFPLFADRNTFDGIISLDDAFKKKCIEFKEVNESGSVPELLAVNNCDKKVLILEGQELKGAKQNRTLNTHILLKEKSETVIPVSCSEQGRWHYKNKNFDLTDKLVSHKLRRSINADVTTNLTLKNDFKSNQRKVWNKINEYMNHFGIRNATSAYHDLFEELKSDISEYNGKFPLQKNQIGVVVFIDGKLEGLEVIADKEIYKQNHDKILKSYMIDDLKIQNRKIKNKLEAFKLPEIKPDYTGRESEMKEIIRYFITAASETGQKVFKSPGLGYEHRLTGGKVTGNILIYNEEPLACHLFPDDNEGNKDLKNFLYRESSDYKEIFPEDIIEL